MNAKLYVVATPIGNMFDISQRALDVLKTVDYVLCEDTRVTRKLLDKYDIEANLISYRQQSIKNSRKLQQIEDLITAGSQMAIVTDAGTPGVSDPGNELIDYLLSLSYRVHAPSRAPSGQPVARLADTTADNFIQIIPIPGPSAVAAAISVCGFDMSRYTFIGFFPKKKREKLIKSLDTNYPFVYFDSPHRLIKNLELIKERIGERSMFVGRELTKLHEEHYRGNISSVLEQLKNSNLKGEVVVVVGVPGKN